MHSFIHLFHPFYIHFLSFIFIHAWHSFHAFYAEHGLTDQQVASQRAIWGTNELDKEDPKSMWALFVEQFDDPLVKILLAAAAVSFAIATADNVGVGEEGVGEGGRRRR